MDESNKEQHQNRAQAPDQDKAEIQYPRPWDYTVIGVDVAKIRAAVKEVIGNEAYTIKPSHKSKGGKYISLAVQTIVLDEPMRTRIFESLRSHADIRMVL